MRRREEIAGQSSRRHGMDHEAVSAGATGRRRKEGPRRMTPTNPIDVFRQEAQDLLAQLEATLLDLDGAPDDPALIDAAFRALHTIKGSGAMFGFDAAAAFTHHVETAFDQVRQGKARLTHDLIAVALRARDHMRLLIESPGKSDPAA